MRRIDMRNFFVGLLSAAACATAGPNYGTVAIKPFGAAQTPPAHFTVGGGHISGSLVDAYVENGCLRGTIGRSPLQLCDEGNNHWTGSSGDVTVAMADGGKMLSLQGYLWLDARRRVSLDGENLELGQGPQWDELRKNPMLLVVATTAADLHGHGYLVTPGY